VKKEVKELPGVKYAKKKIPEEKERPAHLSPQVPEATAEKPASKRIFAAKKKPAFVPEKKKDEAKKKVPEEEETGEEDSAEDNNTAEDPPQGEEMTLGDGDL